MKRGNESAASTQERKLARVDQATSTMMQPWSKDTAAQVRYDSVVQNAGRTYKRKLLDQQTTTVIWQGRWLGTKAMHSMTAANGVDGATGNLATCNVYGTIPLACGKFSSLGSAFTTTSALFIDVTRCPNVIDSAGNIRYDLNMFQPHIDGSGNVTLVDLVQSMNTTTHVNECYGPVDKSAALVKTWTPYYTARASNSVLTCPGPKGILDSVELKLEAYGAGKRQIKYSVALVQFDDKIAPDFEAQSVPTNRVYASSSPQAQFWNEFARRINYHPWSVGYGPMNQMKILPGTYMDNFDIAPTQNTDGDTDPQCVLKKYFFNLGRRCDFVWGANATADTSFGNGGMAINNGDTQKMTVEPKARVYLMVMAYNYKNSTLAEYTGATSYDYIPSIAMDVKTRWKVNS